mmetsp:Transcript_6499/g.27709  ORF Transcript_6499/g.27709 Transcript_6499/m.27709 type:complete len:217 (-) Transcript_6499:980-1630(-)
MRLGDADGRVRAHEPGANHERRHVGADEGSAKVGALVAILSRLLRLRRETFRRGGPQRAPGRHLRAYLVQLVLQVALALGQVPLALEPTSLVARGLQVHVAALELRLKFGNLDVEGRRRARPNMGRAAHLRRRLLERVPSRRVARKRAVRGRLDRRPRGERRADVRLQAGHVRVPQRGDVDAFGPPRADFGRARELPLGGQSARVVVRGERPWNAR